MDEVSMEMLNKKMIELMKHLSYPITVSPETLLAIERNLKLNEQEGKDPYYYI